MYVQVISVSMLYGHHLAIPVALANVILHWGEERIRDKKSRRSGRLGTNPSAARMFASENFIVGEGDWRHIFRFHGQPLLLLSRRKTVALA
jgi:hypothetical protein